MVRKKVIPDMVSTPAGWAFLNLPFYINANRNERWRTWMLRKSSNQIKKSGRSSRKRGYPMIEPKELKWPPTVVGGHFMSGERRPGRFRQAHGANKKRPEKSDPTQTSYHIPGRKSTGKRLRMRKICALHKNRCMHLGNIPSWKVGKFVLSYSHKEEIPKQ